MERARTIDIIFAQERILAGQFLIMVANEQGNARSGDLPRTPPTSQMRANLGGGRPARNRVVFINGRRLERVIRPLRETATGNAKHKARSEKPDFQVPSIPSCAYRPS